MNILNFRKYLTVFFTLALLLTAGCDNYLDVNDNPNAATQVQGDKLFPTIIANFGEVRSIELGPGTSFFSQIWTSNGSTGVFNDPVRYTISSFTTGNTWSLAYVTAQKNLKLVIDGAESNEPAKNNVAAQAKILRAYAYYILTTVFGPVPYTEALNADKFPSPHFDDQETVLRGLVTNLTDAVDQIDESSGAPAGVTNGDLIYKGDMSKWRKFGNSLKLRILMLIRNKDSSVDSQISTLLGQPLIRSNADEADFPFYEAEDNANNLWKLNNQFGGFTNAANGNGFIFAGKPIVDLMKDKNDPRLSTYFEYAVDFDDGSQIADEYFGQNAGVFDYDDETSMISQNTIRKTWPSRILSASEVYFYEAEVKASNGNLGEANTSYRAGVQAALDYFDGKPGEISEADKNAYISALPQLESIGKPDALQAIQEQEYIEVYDKGPENWNHWKRTKVPDLNVPEGAVLGDIIRRLPYPPDEIAANPNVPDPIPNDTPMWFEK